MKKYYLSLIIFGFTTTFAFSQTRNISTVRTHYPEVYNSIETSANRQWGGNPKIIQSVIEGQVDAFINILDLDNSKNVALTDAIIKNSLPDTKEQNIRAIKNYRGTALFSKLKCDWYKVQLDYQKNNNTVTSPSFSTKATPPVIKPTSTVKENNTSFAVEFSEPIQETKTNTPPKPTPSRNLGNSQKETSFYRKEAVSNDTYNNKANNTPTSSKDYNQSKPPVRKDANPPVKRSVPVENNTENTATDENLMIWF